MINLMRVRNFSLIVLAFFLILALGWFNWQFHAHAGTWDITTVDDNGNTGMYNSLAVDSLGNIHIAYGDSTGSQLYYATKANGSWTTETIPGTSGIGASMTSLVLDENDQPMIGFFSYSPFGGNDDLMYISKNGDSWSTVETVDSAGSVGFWPSLAVDSNNNPHIAYRDGTNMSGKYASKANGTWTTETFDSTGTSAGEFLSLTIDSDNRPNIVYRHISGGPNALKYTVKSAGSWVYETVASGVDPERTSIKIGTNDSIQVAYFDAETGQDDLKFAYKPNGGAWSNSTVDSSSAEVGRSATLGLDSSNNPRIAYYDDTNGSLKYASYDSNAWSTETITNATHGAIHAVVPDIGFGLDSSNNAHISFRDDASTSLKYATTQVAASNPSLTINNGEATTNFREVTLALAADGEPTQMTVGESRNLSGIAAEPFSTTKTLALSDGEGPKVVYARIANASGETNIVSASIYYERTPSYGIATVPGQGGASQVRTFNRTGDAQYTPGFYSYPTTLTSGFNVATGDLNGDRHDEIITVPKNGAAAQVRIFDRFGNPIFTPGFYAYDKNYRCGADVTAADLDGNGRDEIITIPGEGCPGQVRIFDYTGQPTLAPGFYAYNLNTRNGFRISAGDVNGDGRAEIVTAPEKGALAQVRIFDYQGNPQFVPSFLAYDFYRCGADVAVADLNNDNRAEIITIPGGDYPAQVRIFNQLGQQVLNPGFYAYEKNIATGFSINAGDLNGDGHAEIVTAPKDLHPAQVRTFDFTGEPIFTPGFYAYEQSLQSGADVAIGKF
ncbi:FG-GAP repeat domain-containing protein [Patescibacteria group bacterium]